MANKKRTLTFALVGCGRVSKNHLKALTSGRIPAKLNSILSHFTPITTR